VSRDRDNTATTQIARSQSSHQAPRIPTSLCGQPPVGAARAATATSRQRRKHHDASARAKRCDPKVTTQAWCRGRGLRRSYREHRGSAYPVNIPANSLASVAWIDAAAAPVVRTAPCRSGASRDRDNTGMTRVPRSKRLRQTRRSRGCDPSAVPRSRLAPLLQGASRQRLSLERAGHWPESCRPRSGRPARCAHAPPPAQLAHPD
jgi:hypothetical protein